MKRQTLLSTRLPADLVFAGQFHHAVDDKRRIQIPHTLRDKFFLTANPREKNEEGEYVILRHPEKDALIMIPALVMRQMIDSGEATQDIFAHGVVGKMDGQGRALMPEEFMTRVKSASTMPDHLVIVGAGNFVKIFSEEAWAEELKKTKDETGKRIAHIFDDSQPSFHKQ